LRAFGFLLVAEVGGVVFVPDERRVEVVHVEGGGFDKARHGEEQQEHEEALSTRP
jgi:hypothetical protein